MFALTRSSCLLSLLLAPGIAFAQGEFSADIVDLQKTGAPVLAKMYFAHDQRRIEMQAAAGDETAVITLAQSPDLKKRTEMRIQGRGNTIILNLANKTSILVRPQQRTYSQTPLGRMGPREMYGLYAFIQPKDVKNACVEWMQRPGAQSESCRNIGLETLNGRKTVEYDLSCYDEICHLWLDLNLRVLVKRTSKWTTTELRNIQEAAQPAILFQIPVGYTEENPGGIIRTSEPQ